MLILIASSRADGNTVAVVERLKSGLKAAKSTTVDISSLNLRPFSYHNRHDDDGFREVVGQMTVHSQIVFATPVYWYAMSGQMKIFFDRLSDLLMDSDGRRVGRALAGRRVSLLTTGTGAELPSGFTEPFT